MENTYSYFYIRTKITAANGQNIKELPLGFLESAIAKESRAVCIETQNDTLVDSIVMVEFFHGSENVYVLTIVNCRRSIRTQRTDEGNSEVAMLRYKYKAYIADFYPVSPPRALYVPVTLPEQHISQFFRNSNTLKFEACNTYDKGDVVLNITELGFAMRYPMQGSNDRNDRYTRLLILQALMLTYAWHMKKMTDEMIEILEEEKPFAAIF